MTMPAGIQKKTKDNSKKKYRAQSEWMRGKRLGRPKQVWIPRTVTTEGYPDGGYWEKV